MGEAVSSPSAPSPGLTYQLLRSDGEAACVALQGHLRLSEAGVLRELMQALATSPPPATYLDLAGIQFIDSTGLGLLTAMHRELTERRSRLFLVAPPPTVLSVLRLSKLDQLFEIVPEAEAAALRERLLGPAPGGQTPH